MVTATTLSNSRLYYMEPEPCLIPFLEKDWMAHFVPEGFPEREQYYRLYAGLRKKRRSGNTKI